MSKKRPALPAEQRAAQPVVYHKLGRDIFVREDGKVFRLTPAQGIGTHAVNSGVFEPTGKRINVHTLEVRKDATVAVMEATELLLSDLPSENGRASNESVSNINGATELSEQDWPMGVTGGVKNG